MAAVLLRRIYTSSFEEFWPQFSPESQAQLKERTIVSIQGEPNAALRKKICECGAEFARNLLGECWWTVIVTTLIESCCLILIKCRRCLNVFMRLRASKSFFDFNDIWYVGRGRWLIHDGIQYEPLQVGNSAIFKGYFLPHLQWGWQMTTDSYIRAQYLQLIRAWFLGRLLRVDQIKPVSKNVRPSVRPSVHKKFLWFQWNLLCR